MHNGKVKQIVGGSLRDEGDQARENFVSEKDAGFYADFYQEAGLSGGHIIMLNPPGSEYYESTRAQALQALGRQKGRWQIGGGIRVENAAAFLDAGASHVIVTSYVFRDGQIYYENLEKLVREIGREHLVLDLSCRQRRETDGTAAPYIVTDRWQKFTDVRLCGEVLDELGGYCDEFLIHAADVEGKAQGIEQGIASMLGAWQGIPVTYAGGVGTLDDLRLLKKLGQNHLDVTVGSALDLFGGHLSFADVIELCEN
jgi:phosphoribosylformimino-5-aminoimidazole carboxamide ribotide isomerase